MKRLVRSHRKATVALATLASTLLLAFPLAFAGNGGDDGLVGGLPFQGGGPSPASLDLRPAFVFVGSDAAIAGSIGQVYHRGNVHLAGGDASVLAVEDRLHLVVDVARSAITGLETYVWVPDDRARVTTLSYLPGASPVSLTNGVLDVDLPAALQAMHVLSMEEFTFVLTGNSLMERLVLARDPVDPVAVHVILEPM